MGAVRERFWARPRYRAYLASPVFIVVPLLALGCNALPLRFEGNRTTKDAFQRGAAGATLAGWRDERVKSGRT